jgi:putative colanic acid biosynthesis UDP-glucose lipid carrier transferase
MKMNLLQDWEITIPSWRPDISINEDIVEEVVRICNKHTTRVKIIPDYFKLVSSKYNISMFGPFPIISVREDKINEFHWRLLKRAFDTTFSFFLFTFIFSWLWPIIAIAIKLDSKGPVFFLQRRVGLEGKEFLIFKFRSMVEDAEVRTGPVMAQEDDPRITKIGRILRKYRLDEFPQLINVLFGEMSLIGPRPERVEFVEKFSREIPGYKRRFLVRPGITGLAQVRSSYTLDPENKLRYDLTYINDWCLMLDLEILIETLRVVIFKKGAV